MVGAGQQPKGVFLREEYKLSAESFWVSLYFECNGGLISFAI